MYTKNIFINVLLGVIAIGLTWSFFSKTEEQKIIPYKSEPTYTQESKVIRNCTLLEPENPYDQGSGHYAGYEWGENGKACGGNSNSFTEGCEEYESQEENYSNCLN